MLNIYVSRQLPLGVQSEFPYQLNEDDTFATLKLKIAEKTGVHPKYQKLSIGVPPKYRLSDMDDFNDEWTLNMLLSDHTCMTLECEEVTEHVSHNDFVEGDLTASFDPNYVPDLEVKEIREHIYEVPQILSKEECASLIDAGEALGFEELFNTNPNYRTNTRVVVQDPDFAKQLFERMRDIVPEQRDSIDGSSWRSYGLNETFRLCKYVPGQYFSKHEDAYYARNNNQISFYTVNLYLNEEFEKGATRFFEDDSDEPYGKVQPTTGKALIFEHFTQAFQHDGEAVEGGVKYILRTDVMYKRILEDELIDLQSKRSESQEERLEQSNMLVGD